MTKEMYKQKSLVFENTLRQLIDFDSLSKEQIGDVLLCVWNTDHHRSLKTGKYKDATYFIFENDILGKIGKVGGGTRCMKKRANDYRSKGDPLGRKILESIKKGNEIIIWCLSMPEKLHEVYGVKIPGIFGPQLEKHLIDKALKAGMELKWNKNKG